MGVMRTFRERLQWRLGPRLIGLVVMTALLAGGLVGVVLIQNSRSALRGHILESDLAAADLAARFAANYVEGAETNVRQFAIRPSFLRAVFDNDVEQAESLLAQFLQIDARFDNIAVYDATGIGWASGLLDKWQNRGGSVADREWFLQTVAIRKPYLGVPVLSRGTGRPIAVYAVPLFDDQGEMHAILVSDISLTALSDAITGIGVSPYARASLMDSRQGGIILAHPDQSRILTPVSGQNAAALRAVAGERGTLETRSSSGELDLAAFTSVPELPWSVLILEPVATAYAPLNHLSTQAALYTALVMLMATVLGILLARAITRPVRQLIGGAEEIGQGNLDYRIAVAGRDEIGQLARAFNQMTEDLQAITASRDELNREIVARQQAEERIAHLNAVLRAIRKVNQLIVREKDCDRLLQGACTGLIETRGYQGAWIALMDESGKLAAAAEAGLGEGFPPLAEQLKRGEPIYCTRSALAQADVLTIQDPVSTCAGCPLSSGYGNRGGMAVRLEHGGKVYGLLTVSTPAELVADEEEQGLFEEVARDIALALHNIEQEEKRKRAEEALRESEHLLRMVADNIPALVSYMAPDRRYRFVNQRYAENFRKPVADVIGKPYRDVVGEAYYQATLNNVNAAFSGQRVSYETTLDLPEIGARWLMVSCTPDIEEPGNVKGIFIAGYDITERKRAEEQLREKETTLRIFLNAIQESASLIDRDGTVLVANETLARRMHRTVEEMTGTNVFNYFPPEVAENRRTYMTKVIESGKPVQFEDRRLDRIIDNLVYPVFDTDGQIRKLAVLANDITARKQAEEILRESEERYRTLFENAQIGIYRTTPDGRILAANPALIQMLGYASFAELAARNLEQDGFEPDYPRRRFKEQLEREGEVRGLDSVWTRRDGAAIFVRENAQAIRGKDGRILYYEGTVEDVTERKRADEEIRRLYAELEQRVVERTAQLQAANKELESFSYSVSHDLRAPLRGIDGWSLALVEDYGDQLDRPAHQYLDRVRAEVQRMGQLIDDLLQLSRVTRAKMRMGPVDLSSLAQSVAARLRAAQPERQVELTVQPGLAARGDARLLEIALTNLLDNAWKFSARRAPARIEFGHLTPCPPLLPGEGEGGEVYFVRDNGVGFDMAFAQKLFGAFQRLHKASEFPGTGIGLATVQRIIHRHGGRVWAEAEVDQGATFYFTLWTSEV
jgi:PAS domain S-box-containing protein